jgi:exodeoxyribonuclease VII large subunit
LYLQRPDRLLKDLGGKVAVAQKRLQQVMAQVLTLCEQRMVASARMLESLSPLPTLARGYTVLRDPSGPVISQTAELAVGQEVYGQMQDGRFTAKILDTEPGKRLNDTQSLPTEQK